VYDLGQIMTRHSGNLGKIGLLNWLIEDLKLFVSLIRDYRSGAYKKFPFLSVAGIGFTLIYIISPIDLIPDYIIGIGQIDDAAILGFCFYLLRKDVRKYKEWLKANE
jgi:uncharacterized membrane protein YkvA (DUF1232 family)